VDGNGTNYVTSASYNPDSSLKNLLNGSAPALSQNFQYTPRLQLCRITALTSGTLPTSCTDSQNVGNIMDRGYDFHAGNGIAGSGSDNGNVFAITNYRDSNRSQAFTYDALNRLTSGWSSANTGTYSWGENYSIDAWGNLQISPMSGKAHGGTFQLSGNTQNRPTGLAYDAAGNLMSYLSATYTYDQENRLSSTAGMSYTYDGNGERLLKSNTSTGAAVKRYWSMGGNTLAEDDGSGNLTAEYIYFAGKRVARIDLPAGSVHYYISDHLNSTSMVVSASGVPEEESDYSPFGTEYKITSGLNHYKFTGKERDAESGLDYFGARYLSSSFGRFVAPDPLLNSGRPNDPQSWNRYSYVRNNPLNRIDPTGLYDLKNTCPGDDKKCNKQFEQHAKDLKNGQKNLQDKLKDVKDPTQRARLEASLKALGTEGDHNGVNVGFGATKGGGAGETDAIYDSKTNTYTGFNVTLDPKKLSSQNDYAVAGAHEGTHVSDYQNYELNPATMMSLFQLEYRGYQTSAFAASALGTPSLSQNYDGKSYPIWNGSWGAVDKNITNFVTKFHDKNGQQTAPETIPHNPQPN
jgi:RHS repeat-associated protein